MRYTLCPDAPPEWRGTHFLRCKHAYNSRSSTRYLMYCDVLKSMPDGRLKICVYGERWIHTRGNRIRYISAHRVIPVEEFRPVT